jgi:O-antigen/teichoic acid export membrane protein
MAVFAFIGIFIFFSFLFFTHSEQLHHNLIQLVIYMICALLELLCEPIILYMNLKVENKFIPITISSLTRIITNTILAVFFKLELWSFTLSRVTGSLVYLSYISYLGYFKYKINFRDFIPKDIGLLIRGKEKEEINIQYLRVVLFQFIRLNLLNLIIQNCEGLILSFVIKNSEEEKSDYSFVAQNFSLLLRFFIEPVTDGFYILVNKLKYLEKKTESKIININNDDVNKDFDNNVNNANEDVLKIEKEKNDENNINIKAYEKQDSPDAIIDKENTDSNGSDNDNENEKKK